MGAFWRASCRIRTNDPEITNHVLWPTELKRRVGKLSISRRSTHYLCYVPVLEDSRGADRIGLTHVFLQVQRYTFFAKRENFCPKIAFPAAVLSVFNTRGGVEKGEKGKKEKVKKTPFGVHSPFRSFILVIYFNLSTLFYSVYELIRRMSRLLSCSTSYSPTDAAMCELPTPLWSVRKT